MHAHAQLIEKFYAAFGRQDHAGMLACYAPSVEFSDPVFKLSGKEPGAMWHMLCEQAKGLKVVATNIQADDTQGSAHWEAWYPFSATGRNVHNVIDAKFTFAGGHIVTHHDTFDFYQWTRMALGPVGTLLGWTPMLQGTVRKQARKGLEKFIARHPEHQG